MKSVNLAGRCAHLSARRDPNLVAGFPWLFPFQGHPQTDDVVPMIAGTVVPATATTKERI